MTYYLTTGGKYHLPRYIDWQRGIAESECGRLECKPVEADPHPDDICESCEEAAE